jgi:alkanesulfonate monooxygenase SsuD/methylene tetrahydromethanopterin reductase-like flavin-dependent oxidoreductase (luciferase family)
MDVPAMEFGIFHEFLSAGAAQPVSFAQSFEQIAAAEAWGLDILWVAEIHMNPTRCLVSSPLTVLSAVAARTNRIRIGPAVQLLPLGHPLRLAEEAATLDQISGGRLVFGVGRSAFPGAYRAYGISYEESQVMFAESLAIIRNVWTNPQASHAGHYWRFDGFTLVPRPVQTPHPPIRIAASRPETYAAIGTLGYPLLCALRASAIDDLAANLRAYRAAWAEAGHPGAPRAYLQIPILVGETQAEAEAAAKDGLMRFASYRADLVRGPLTYDVALRQKGFVGTPDHVASRIAALREATGIDGLSAEINVGSLMTHEQVMRSLRLFCQEVVPRFR